MSNKRNWSDAGREIQDARRSVRAKRKATPIVTPGLREMLEAWDKAVQDAKDLRAAQERARRAPKPSLDDTPSILEHAWPFIVRGLATE